MTTHARGEPEGTAVGVTREPAPSEHRLVGREAELAALAGRLDALTTGATGSIVQIAGEPGIGKSRLLRELMAVAGSRGHLVLDGRAAEFEAESPFGLFVDALDDWLLSLEAERRSTLAAGAASELAMVLPAFEELAHDHPPRLQQERYRAHRAIRRLLGALAAERPVVLVLDDVQWADPGSVELLCHLVAKPPRQAVLIALAYRPAPMPRALGRALAAAARRPDTVHLILPPLSSAAAARLVASEGGAAERLYRETGGNPLFLLQLARVDTLRESADPSRERTVPATIRAALGTELESVSTSGRALLQGAAVVGDPFDLATAAHAAELDDADALDLIDELLDFQLVASTSASGRYAFRHPIVRATVYETSGRRWRTDAHERVAALLAARGADVATQAPHVERSARSGDLAATTVLAAAGDEQVRRAPALAARWYGAAAHLLADGPTAGPRRTQLLVAQASALAGSGRLPQARNILRDLLDRLPGEDPQRVAVVAACAGIEHLLGRHRDAQARLTEALQAVDDGRSPEAVLLQVELAAGAGFENRHEDMAAWAHQARDGATTLGDRALQVVADGQIALARYFAGLPAGDALARAVTGMDSLTDEELATRLDIGLWVGWTEAVLEHHQRAVDHCQRVIDIARATGQGATLLLTQTAQAWALLRSGRLDEAEATLVAALDAGRMAPNLFLAVAAGLSAVLCTYRGDHEGAIRLGEEGVELARSADPGLIPGMSGLHLAVPLLEAGQARRARDVLLEMSAGKPELQTSRSGHAAAFEVLTRAEIALGRPDAAEFWARRAETAGHGGALPAEAAFADRAVATVALTKGDDERAAQLAQLAARRAHAGGAPVEAGRCEIIAGRALAALDQRAEAIATLERAAHGLGAVGARGYGAEAERELRRLGRRGGTAVAAPPVAGAEMASLSAREREIAELVGLERTNREIAATLYLSEKTVERNLSRMYAKLGVRGRTALALLVASQDRDRQDRATPGD